MSRVAVPSIKQKVENEIKLVEILLSPFENFVVIWPTAGLTALFFQSESAAARALNEN